jgi:protein O-mannosyl-transferase
VSIRIVSWNRECIVPQPNSQETGLPQRTEFLALAGLLAITLLTFSSTFRFGWVYDDPPQIPQNPNLEWKRIGFLLTHPLWAFNGVGQNRFYRPLLSLWFLVNKSIFGLHPHWFHLTSVLAHLAATTLAYFIAKEILKSQAASLFSAAIFALHPLQTEAVSWISSVNDPLAAIFCFASFLMYRKAQIKENSAPYWTLAGIFFVLALFTKEVSIVLPGIIFVDLLSSHRYGSQPGLSRRFPLFYFCGFTLLIVPWFAVRAGVIGGIAIRSNPVPFATALLSAPKVLLFDFYHVVVPVGLSPQYVLQLITHPNSQFIIFLSAFAIVAALAIVLALCDSRLWVAYAWLVFPLLPTLNLGWMNEDDYIHDRYMYMSMLGVALLAGLAFAWLRQKWPRQILIRPLAAALALILAFSTTTQSQYWANDVILFSCSVTRAPRNEWAQLNYGSALSARGEYSQAAVHFVSSYEIKPGWRAADFAGFSYLQIGDFDQAEQWFDEALKYDPRLGIAWFGLGQTRLAQHQPEQAIPYFRKALEFDPTADGFHYELGTALEAVSQRKEAMEEYKTELQLHPHQTAASTAIERLESENNRAK